MAFAMNPDEGYARIFRYVEPGTLPSRNLLCVYDRSQNLLVIGKEKFAQLSDTERHLVLRTHRPFIEVASAIAA
jgi:hypothetical protein